MKRFLLSLAVVLALVSRASAQSLPLLTRTTALTGLNDSALTLISDSAQRTRAGTTHELFKRPNGLVSKPSFAFALDSTTGMYRATGGQLNFTVANGEILRLSSGGTVSAMLGLISGGAGNLTITAGTGNSRTMTLQTTTSAGTAKNTLVLGADTSATFLGKIKMPDGDVSSPSYGFTGSVNAGLYRVGGHMAFAIGGQNVFDLATATLTLGNGGSFSVAPTGNSSALNLQATTAGGAASTMLALSTASGVDASNATAFIAPATVSNLSALNGRAGDMTITAGTGNSRRLALQTTTSGGVATVAMRFNEAQQALVPSGTAARPVYSFTADTTTGMHLNAAAEIAFSFAGTNTWRWSGTRIRATGRFMAANGSATYPDFTFAGDSTMGMYRFGNSAPGSDSLAFSTNGTVKLIIAGNAATAAGDEALCIKTTGVVRVMTQGATCGTSSRKVKHGVTPINDPVRKLMALRPVTYSYRPQFYGGRSEFGLIAEEAAAVDRRLAFYASANDRLPTGDTIKKGDPLNVNDRAVLALLVATVQRQQRQIDSLLALRKP